jgi:hypothetical protein
MPIPIRYLPYHLDPLGLRTVRQTRTTSVIRAMSMFFVAVMAVAELSFLVIILWHAL